MRGKSDIERLQPGERLFTVHGRQFFSVSVNVRLRPEQLQQIANDLDTTVEKLTIDDLAEAIRDQAYEYFPVGLCAQDTGYYQTTDDDLSWSRDEDDTGEMFEASNTARAADTPEDEDIVEIKRESGIVDG